jgi:hypothetical protein
MRSNSWGDLKNLSSKSESRTSYYIVIVKAGAEAVVFSEFDFEDLE